MQDEADEFRMNEDEEPRELYQRLTTLAVSLQDHGSKDTDDNWIKRKFLKAFTTKKDTSVTFWAERIFFCHTYDTSMTIIVTKPGIIIHVVGSYFYDKKS